MIADRSLVPVPAEVVGRFAHEFEQLLLAVTVGALAAGGRAAAGRRTPAKPPSSKRKLRQTAANESASPAKRLRQRSGTRDKR
jgi:hypothetical protein